MAMYTGAVPMTWQDHLYPGSARMTDIRNITFGKTDETTNKSIRAHRNILGTSWDFDQLFSHFDWFFVSDTLSCASCATFLFSAHFDVICDLFLNRRTAL